MKAIVLDIDGTLLSDQKTILPKTKQALIQAQKDGTQVILASGRPTRGMLKYVQELEMDVHGGFVISYNGSRVTDCRTGEVLFDCAIPGELSKKVLKHLEAFDVIPMINDEDYMYVSNVFGGTLDLPKGKFNIIEYEARGGGFLLCEKRDLAGFADFPLNKILIAGNEDYLQQVHEEIYAPFRETLKGAFSASVYFEITNKGIDKAKALEIVLGRFGISQKEVIAFGDAHNDRSMLEYAGVGVVMGNAGEDMKAMADFVTLSNNEEGIAWGLERFL